MNSINKQIKETEESGGKEEKVNASCPHRHGCLTFFLCLSLCFKVGCKAENDNKLVVSEEDSPFVF